MSITATRTGVTRLIVGHRPRMILTSPPGLGQRYERIGITRSYRLLLVV